MKRTIWPVGHGAFYTEVFQGVNRPFSVVYDCGATTFDLITEKIDNFLATIPHAEKENPVVDMVFISHFHKDHINGLKYLLNKAEVRNLIIPQIDQNALLEAYLYNACANVDKEKKGDINSDEQNIIFNLATEGRIEGVANLVQVYPYDESYKDSEQLDGLMYDIEEKNALSRFINSGRSVLAKFWDDLLWEYIPVNVFEDAQGKLQNLINELAKIVYNGTSLVNQGQIVFSRLKSYLQKNSIKQIKQAYEKVFCKNDNIYSMPVYSGPVEYESEKYVLLHSSVDCLCNFRECCRRHHCCVSCFKKYIRLAVSCLYTGDFEPKSKLNGQSFVNIVKNILKRRWDYIGMVQIPHHASSNNYSDELYEIPRLAFANVNNHGDISFSQSVIRDIQWMGCRTMIVTEKDKQQYFDILF